MNEPYDELQRRLELATAQRLPPDSSLDTETAELREGWLALCELLPPAEQAELPAWAANLVEPVRPAWRSRGGLMAGIAVSLALVVGAGLMLWSGRLWSPSREPAGATPVAKTGDLGAPSTVVASVEDARWAWDDSLDTQLEEATQTLVAIRSQWHRSSSEYSLWQQQLEQLRAELNDGAL